MKPNFFINNRESFVRSIKGGVAVICGYSSLQRGNDAAFYFEQEANFWWLTGIEAPDWWVIIDGQRSKSWLVAPHVSDTHQVFDGSLSSEHARATSGVEGVLTQDAAMDMLRDLAKKHSVVYSIGDPVHVEYFDFVLNPAPKKHWMMLDRIFTDVLDSRLLLAKLRAIKQPEEIAAMKKAIKLTVDAFKIVKEQLPSLRHEYEVEAEFSYFFKKNSAADHAYDPIVAGAKNACTLHYNSNTDKLKKGSLLLMDVGARVDGYAADITRTYAVGEPTSRQRQVHRAVETAHKEIIGLLKPGVSVVAYHNEVDLIMKKALIEIGLLESMDDNETYRRYFPHAISHGLGVDVHDALGQPSEFLSGMVLTVEPGIYIPEEGIGVRIEDDILITEQGNINLSKALPIAL